MVTTVTTVSNTTANAVQDFNSQLPGQGGALQLSDLAREALAGLNTMQASYSGPVQGTGAAPGLIRPPEVSQSPEAPADYANMTREMTQAIENSVRVQAQLGQFMMTASISTTMGSNLNTFLKGQ